MDFTCTIFKLIGCLRFIFCVHHFNWEGVPVREDTLKNKYILVVEPQSSGPPWNLIVLFRVLPVSFSFDENSYSFLIFQGNPLCGSTTNKNTYFFVCLPITSIEKKYRFTDFSLTGLTDLKVTERGLTPPPLS